MDAYLPPTLPRGLPAVLEGAEVSGLERAVRAAQGRASERLRTTLTCRKGMRYWGTRMRATARSRRRRQDEADALRRALARRNGRATPKVIRSVVVVPNGVDVAAFPPRDRSAVVPGRMIYYRLADVRAEPGRGGVFCAGGVAVDRRAGTRRASRGDGADTGGTPLPVLLQRSFCRLPARPQADPSIRVRLRRAAPLRAAGRA